METEPKTDIVPAPPGAPAKRRMHRKKFTFRFDENAPVISQSVRREICKRIALGETLKALSDDERIPPTHHIYDLIWRDPAFESMYRKARLARAEVWAEELRELAKEASDLDADPKKAMAHVQAIRIRVETDKWLLSKILSSQYGDTLPTQGGPTQGMGALLQIIQAVASLAREKPVKGEVIIPALEDKK